MILEAFYTVVLTCILPRSIVAPSRHKEDDVIDFKFSVSIKGEHTLEELKNNYYNSVSLLGINPETFKFYKNSAFIVSADDAAAMITNGLMLQTKGNERTVIISALDLASIFVLLLSHGQDVYTVNLVSRSSFKHKDVVLVGAGGVIVDKVIGFQSSL
jgi:hypothetical protein